MPSCLSVLCDFFRCRTQHENTQITFHNIQIPDEMLDATTFMVGFENLAPGEGPSKETRDNGYFWIDYTAKAQVDGEEIVCIGLSLIHI